MGLRTGLLGGLARLAGVFLGLAAAFNFYRALADMVNLKWNLAAAISRWFHFTPSGAAPALSGGPSVPAGGIPGAEGLIQGSRGALQGLGESAARVAGSGMLEIICFIAIFFVVSWAVGTAGAILGKVARLFFLGPADRIGGIALGAARGLVMALVLVALAGALEVPAAFMSGGLHSSWIGLALQKSVLAPYFVKALVVLNVKLPGWGI